jgi:uncharacterized protein involved in exopolysaccharide biosynthesis
MPSRPAGMVKSTVTRTLRKPRGPIRSRIRESAIPLSSLDITLLELAAENAELRLQLAEAQDQCIEMAVDAGTLQAEINALKAEIAELRGIASPPA